MLAAVGRATFVGTCVGAALGVMGGFLILGPAVVAAGAVTGALGGAVAGAVGGALVRGSSRQDEARR